MRAEDMNSLLATLGCLLLLAGCASRTMEAKMLLPAPQYVGAFTLGTNVASVQDLLSRLRARAPQALQQRGFEKVRFEDDAYRQWAVVTFSNPAWVDWTFGVQFVRTPSETGNRVHAVIRAVQMNDGEQPNMDRLIPLLQDLQAALEAAGG